jgi:hypothetical protein
VNISHTLPIGGIFVAVASFMARGITNQRESLMTSRWILSACLLTLAACASAKPGVLLVEDEKRVQGCRPLGTVSDNELDDLQKKAAELGGNVALMTPQRKTKGGYFGLQEYMTADVYRCDGNK